MSIFHQHRRPGPHRRAWCSLTLARWCSPAVARRRDRRQTPTTVNVSGGSQGASQTVPTGQDAIRLARAAEAERREHAVAGRDRHRRPHRQGRQPEGRADLADRNRAGARDRDAPVDAGNQAARRRGRDQPAGSGELQRLALRRRARRQRPRSAGARAGRAAKKEIVAEGPPVSVGCAGAGQGVSTTERAIFIPCGDGGDASDGRRRRSSSFRSRSRRRSRACRAFPA